MKFKEIVMLALAAGCGFLGGLAATRLRSVAVQTSNIVRTPRVELMDASGRRRAILGMDSQDRQASLSFLTQDGKTVASFGVGGTLPFIHLFGVDGKNRAALTLTTLERPYLALGDEIREGRVVLGAFEGDVVPADKAQTRWGLVFMGAGLGPIASIGMIPNRANQSFSGTLFVSNPKGSFRVPQE